MSNLPGAKEDKLFAAISYIGILCFIPLILKKKSNYVQFHAKQGTVLFIAEVVAFFVNILPVICQILWFIAAVFFLVVSITGAKKAYEGKRWDLPILGKYAGKIEL